MPVDVIMPALGVAQDTGTVRRWLKQEGELVAKGAPLLEVETDKATVEIEAPGAGRLVGVTAVEGAPIPVGAVIARIVGVGEAEAVPVPTAAAMLPTIPVPDERSSEPVVPSAAATPDRAPVSEGSSTVRRRLPASPKARLRAQTLGVDLAATTGSGPGGAIVAGDVMAALPGAMASPEGAVPDAHSSSAIWRLMVERTTLAWTTVPHFFLIRHVDVSRLAGWRESYMKRNKTDVTYTDLLIRVMAAALCRHPDLNAQWSQGAVVRGDAVNIGLAVSVEDGLVVPVLHHVDRLSVLDIAQRRRNLVDRARTRNLRPEDLRDGIFTISNLGMHGVDAFAAIINAPQAAILAVGRIADRIVPVAGRPAVRPMMTLTLSCDHRVVTGANAAEFLRTLAALIEEPAGLVE